MQFRFRYLVTLVMILFFVHLSATPAPVPAGVAPFVFYLPTKKGDRWTYLVRNENRKDEDVELIEEVTSIENRNGSKIITVARVENGKFIPNREREVSAKGVFQTRDDDDEKLCEPYLLLKLPHKENQTWVIPLVKRTLTAEGPEKVEVPAGTFEAIKVEIRKDGNKDNAPFQIDWYAPRVGIVKVQRGKMLIVMKSFTPGKDE